MELFGVVFSGGVAQLGEQLLCTQQVVGSIPIASTISFTTFSRHSSAVELLVYTQTVVGSNPSASTTFPAKDEAARVPGLSRLD